MLQRDRYREVFEMLKEVIMAWFSAGQEGQEKSGSVSSMISLGNFPYSRALYAPKGTKGRKFQEILIVMFQKSVQNFVPFVPVREVWGIWGRKDRNFPMKKNIEKSLPARALKTPLVPGVI